MDETLGLLGHPGGILVDHPRLRVGVVAAISRRDGLELELVARSPRNPDSMTDPPAPRVLLPRYEEGMNLRVAWLDADDRPHWEYGSVDVSTGYPFNGTVLQTRMLLPPMFDRARIVLAWPEIGFPEAVVTLPLPDREAVTDAEVSVWTAPVDARPVPTGLAFRPTTLHSLDVDAEAGLILSGPRVLHRGDHAVVVLTRLTLVGPALSLDIHSIARGRPGGVATMAAMYGPRHRSHAENPPEGPTRTGRIEPEHPRDPGVGASIALLHPAATDGSDTGDATDGSDTDGATDGAAIGDTADRAAIGETADRAAIGGGGASWLMPAKGTTAGGEDTFSGRAEYAFDRPASAFLDLVVGWPEAGLADAHVRLPLIT
ncbi:hypothetical protein [Virgisporangium aurantiacum]|uniref:Uncharacterized protein n=1 Tax=Virgisporangium aurantiacum TaxID=175570 RepID=A0A8J3YZY0_9ACTN|nr:hypothetical protein [Virgisporangium aurantiacum]GIJ55099.1 hypothetical protein Vau01_026150 [Virgisporangium aurantiacum]